MKNVRLLLAVVVFTVVAFTILEISLRNWFLKRNESELFRVIDATTESINRINASPEDMQLITDNIGLVATHYQITIADQSGQVLGDSLLLSSVQQSLHNILRYPEVQMALKAEVGKSIHLNQSGAELFYVAKRIEHNNQVLIIRVAMNNQDYRSAVSSLREFLTLMAIGLFVLIGLFMFVYLRFLNKSIAAERSLLENRVNERTQDILLLQRLTRMLAACQDSHELQQVVDDMLPRIIGNIACAISLLDTEQHLLATKLTWGGDWLGDKSFPPEGCWALRKGSYHLSKDALSQQKCQHMAGCDDNVLCIPLLAHGQTIGVFHLVVGDNFSAEARRIASTLAEHIGLALANLNLQETLRHQAAKDPLTGLYNRRYMEEVLELELSRTSRYQSSFALLMLDIDHFKIFNDTFGHDAGDFVLKYLSTVLISAVRKEDVVCRIGGEEIAIILPEGNAETATVCAQKLCQLVKEKNLVFNDLPLGKLTISIGISIFPNHAKTYQALIKAADVELYKVKNKGRNGFSINGEVTLYDSNMQGKIQQQ